MNHLFKKQIWIDNVCIQILGVLPPANILAHKEILNGYINTCCVCL